MSQNVSDTERRFEIFVPKPKARINLGKRNADAQTGPFGYTGVSIQSDAHLFIDANINTLYQTGKSYCGQVGGQWRQFSNSGMFVSSTATMNVSASHQIVIASGAGQGQITALDHGMNMRLVPYNELDLHYVVDTLQTGLFEFFHGRHDRHETTFGLIKPVEQALFFSRRNAAVSRTASPAKPRSDEDAHDGGFLGTVARSWELMERGVREDALQAPEPERVPALGPILEAGIARGGKAEEALEKLRYGFSGYLKRFDPYKLDEGGWLAKLHVAVVTLKRFVHVALKYGEALQSLPIVSQAIQGMEALDALVGAAWNARNAVADSFPAFVTFKTGADGGWGKAGVVDEATSGLSARFQGVSDSLADTRKATITSTAEPPDGWALQVGTTYRMSVAWKDGNRNDVVSLSPSGAQPATMDIEAPTRPSTPELKTLAIRVGGATHDVPLDPASTSDAASFAATLDSQLTGATASVVRQKVRIEGQPSIRLGSDAPGPELAWTKPADTAAGNYSLTINGERVQVPLRRADLASASAFAGAVRAAVDGRATVSESGDGVLVTPLAPVVALSGSADTPSLLARMSVGSDAYRNDSPTLELAPPHLRTGGEVESLVLSIDGASFTVRVAPNTTLHDALFAVEQIPLLAEISGSGNGPITLTTRSQGADSRIRVVRATHPTEWRFHPSDDQSGADASAQTITAAELVEKVGSLEHLRASTKTQDGSMRFVLEAVAEGEGSKAEASGNLAALVFGADPKTETITGPPAARDRAGFGSLDDAVKTLRSWNHELQKLPEDTRNLTRPLTNALSDALGAVSGLESMLNKGQEVVKGAPPPPEAIGLLANGGITLGTQDRIVGTGGRGIVFISDGGTGSPDRGKFVLSEGWVADLEEWSANLFKAPEEPPSARSLGFRVLSDSVVDMTSTVSASLAAMGRAKAKEARLDERKEGVGIGIARVLGSYASEVAGYEKVVISARAPGQDDDEAGATGGRVELLGQRVVIGGVSEEHTLGNSIKQSLTDFAGTGTEAFELEGVDGMEHLEGGPQEDEDFLANPLADVAWSPALRKAHPRTTHVDVHASAQVETVVLPFRIRLTKEGAKVGVVLPEEADRKAELKAEEARTSRWLEVAKCLRRCVDVRLDASKLMLRVAEGRRDDPTNALRAEALGERCQELERSIASLEARLQAYDEDLEEARSQHRAAKAALDAFEADWKEKGFPQLELTEDKIRLGFVAGSGAWEDFAYLEITQEGIRMFQPKSKGKPTFDLKKDAARVADGSEDAYFEAKGGDLKLKLKGKAEAGPLKWDAQGNVKIG